MQKVFAGNVRKAPGGHPALDMRMRITIIRTMTGRNPTSSRTATAKSRAARCAEVPGRRRVDSATLFQGARELIIIHNGEPYCLHVTRNEKLILTK